MLTSPLLDHPRIAHGFFTRQGGVSDGLYGTLNCGLGSGDDPDHVLENRKRVAEGLGTTADRLVTVFQIHSPNVLTIDAPFAGERPQADGLVTTVPGLAIGALAADCTPLLFAEPETGVVGAAHAGWRGALAGVAEATVDAMVRAGAERHRIAAVIGPTISQANYEIGPDFAAAFMEADPENARFFVPSDKKGHAQFDLPGYLMHRLSGLGLAATADLATCTYADPDRFFSYRRTCHRGEPDYGRQISAIALKA